MRASWFVAAIAAGALLVAATPAQAGDDLDLGLEVVAVSVIVDISTGSSGSADDLFIVDQEGQIETEP